MPPKQTPAKLSAAAKKAAEEEKIAKEAEEQAAREFREEQQRMEDADAEAELRNEVLRREREEFSEGEIDENSEKNADVIRVLALDGELAKNANEGSEDVLRFREEANLLKQRISFEKLREKNLKLELELKKTGQATHSQSRNLMTDSSQTSLLGFEQKTTVTNKIWTAGILTDDTLRLKLSENSVETLDNIAIWLDTVFVLPREICANGGSVFQNWKNKLVSLDKKVEHMVKIYAKIPEAVQQLQEIKKFLEKCLSDLSFDTEKAGILQYVAVWGTSSVGARVMGTDKGAEIERTMTISKRAFGQKFLHEKSALGLRNIKTGAEVRNQGGYSNNKYAKFNEGGRGGFGDFRGNRGRHRCYNVHLKAGLEFPKI